MFIDTQLGWHLSTYGTLPSVCKCFSLLFIDVSCPSQPQGYDLHLSALSRAMAIPQSPQMQLSQA